MSAERLGGAIHQAASVHTGTNTTETWWQALVPDKTFKNSSLQTIID